MFVIEIFLPVSLGKTIVLASDEECKNPISINDLIIKNSVDYLLLTPTKLELLYLPVAQKHSCIRTKKYLR